MRLRLLQIVGDGVELCTFVGQATVPPYAILSHTWGSDEDEVKYPDVSRGFVMPREDKPGWQKIRFAAKQAALDGLAFFWIDTCCIDKTNSTELSEAINSMFRYYEKAVKCYVYLSDIDTGEHWQRMERARNYTYRLGRFSYDQTVPAPDVESAPDLESVPDFEFVRTAFRPPLRYSRWFTRGWTLQELLAPPVVEFYSVNGERLGCRESLIAKLNDITGIPMEALQGQPLSNFHVEERISWSRNRKTTLSEDQAYCLFGLCGVFLPLIYGEGKDNAFRRLRREIWEVETSRMR